MLVTFDDINLRLPTPLDPTDEHLAKQVNALLEDAEDAITIAFAKFGRSWKQELVTVPWLDAASKRVIRQMVTAAIMVGPNVGVRSVSSTTGPQSDSITYADAIDQVAFGGVRLTDDMLVALGLLDDGGPRGCFPRPLRWPEVR